VVTVNTPSQVGRVWRTTNGGGNTTVTMRRQTNANRDGTLDNGVVAHEWGHFISNRLIGDGSGISNLQAVGMGEGWGDFHAGLMVSMASDATAPGNTNWNGADNSAYSPSGDYIGYGVGGVPDAEDADIIVHALEQGIDVVTEKPMATTAEDCRRILAAHDVGVFLPHVEEVRVVRRLRAVGHAVWWALIPVKRCPWRIESGRFCPRRFASCGLWSNKSNCEGPPARNR